MTLRRTIAVLFTGCAVFSPGANAFWFFQHRAAPVTRLFPSHHHRGHRHHRHYHAHSRQVRTYRRVITEYRIYYVPRPYPPAPTSRAKAIVPGLKHGLPPSAVVPGAPGAQPAPMAAAAASRSPAPAAVAPNSEASASVAAMPTSRPPAAGKLPTADAAQAHGSTLAPIAMQAGTAATSADAHRAAPEVTALPGPPAGRPADAAARPQQVADSSPLAQTAPGGVSPQPTRSAGVLHAPQASSPLAFLAPLVAALAALSGLGYAVLPKRKASSRGTTRQPGAILPQPDPPAAPAAAGTTGAPPAATPRRGFNFDAIRRVNVDRVFMSPFPQAVTGTGAAAVAAATNAGGNTETATHPASSEPPANAGKVVQHAYGDSAQGVVDEIYETPEARARVDGFYAHIPAEFQDLTWMKVTYHQGQIYTFAAAMPGLVIHPGDTVRLVFGQQEPPVPNQVVAVTHVRSASPGKDTGIMDGPV